MAIKMTTPQREPVQFIFIDFSNFQIQLHAVWQSRESLGANEFGGIHLCLSSAKRTLLTDNNVPNNFQYVLIPDGSALIHWYVFGIFYQAAPVP